MTWNSLLTSCLLALPAISLAWKPIATSRTITLGDVPYYVPTEPVLTFSGSEMIGLSGEVVAFTAFSSHGTDFTEESLSATIADWESMDDVFSREFLQAILLQGPGSVSNSASNFFKSKGAEFLVVDGTKSVHASKLKVFKISSRLNLPPGPYVLARGPTGRPAVYAPYRLHFDESQSFFDSLVHQSDGSFAVISASLQTDSSPYIGTPSKVYALSKNETDQPLAGLRVSVKDLFYLKGIKATAGNRHYYQLYPPRNVTAPAISRLVDLGAHMVGTTKMVQFANGDRATADWVDYHCPFSPRGDGNREPSGSSTGAGTSIATLDFLDVSLGSDTGGSVRLPAGVNGVYGIRPSVGAITLDDAVPLSPILDTAGYLARDPKLFAKFGKAWYAEAFESYPAFPSKLLIADDFQLLASPALDIYTAFFGKLQGFLGAELANFSIAAEWNETSGVGVPIATYVNETYSTLVSYYQWTNVGKPFFEDFQAANGGRSPHINPQVRYRWRYGEARGEANYTAELGKQETFENWTMTNFLLGDSESCSESLYLYPTNAGTYTSREVYYTTPETVPLGFSSSRVANLGRSPEVVIPIGQIPYYSSVTEIEEQLPVTVSLVARRGCDFVLLDLVDALADAEIIQTVKTGRTAF